MKLDLGPELEDFREKIRTWVDENRPPGLEELDERAVYLGTAHLSGPAAEAYELWSTRLGQARLICPQWPEAVGGRGLSGVQTAGLNEEFHRALSYVLAPMKDNGIEIAPLRQPTGASGFSQEYIDGCRAPLFNVIGGVNNGWRVAMTTLGNERGGGATTQHLRYERELWDLVDEARKRGRAADPLVRQDLAWAYTHVALMRYQGIRLLATLAARREPGPEASVSKLFWSEYHSRFGELALRVLGPDGMLGAGETGLEYKLGRWQTTFVSSRAGTIFSGTSQI